MKMQILWAALLAIAVGSLSACADDQAKLQESLQKWETARDAAKGNYSYKVTFSSFSGLGHSTEIIVRDHKVAERRFQAFNLREPKPVKPGEAPEYKWIETGDKLGTHKEGAPVKTVDELYKEAATVLKSELTENEKLYLRFDAKGLLQLCFTVDTRIADDAPIKGVRIAEIVIGETGTEKND